MSFVAERDRTQILVMTMSKGFARRARAMLVGLLLTSGFAVRANADTEEEEDDNNFREDVILCEEAVAHVTACCGYEVQGDACRYYHYSFTDDCGCSGTSSTGTRRIDVRPVLTTARSRELVEMECRALTAMGSDGSTMCAQLHAELQADNDESSSSEKRCL